MLEKEIKILEIDKDKVIGNLENFGAKKTFEGFIHDVYYDFIDGENHKMYENKRLFRVRKKGEIHLYTIKRHRKIKSEGGEKGLKISDEGEREITNIESFSKVLEKYGMKKIREKKKYRISYKLSDAEFDIDIYEKIPPLLEIEADKKSIIKKYKKKLGLEENIEKTFGSRKLFKYYGEEYSYF